jgi:FlaA1/EpsC-like NDP-sugar epimerase
MQSIEDRDNLIKTFLQIKPDIVIHAAAFKHINIAEKQPTQAIQVNILGSLNIIEASKAANVPITIGMSSDKACLSNSVYGHTKYLMERIFFESDNEKNRFISCRLCNVVGSYGSVVPFWLDLARKNEPLKITDPKMNRFMLLPEDIASLIKKAIDSASVEKTPFILTKKIQAVNMQDMASCISSNIAVSGKRPGERLDETLVSVKELPFTYLDGDYIFIKSQKNSSKASRLQNVLNTLKSEKINKNDIKRLIKCVETAHENIN